MKHRTMRWIGCLLTLSATPGLIFTPVALAQDLNCSDFDSQEAAQAELQNDPTDPNNLDDDNNGIACETLPPREGTPEGEQQTGQPKDQPKQQPKKPTIEKPKDRAPEQNKELLKAGGDLPVPQEPTKQPGTERFPLWRVTGMVMSASVFVFALYLFVSRRR